MKEFLNWSDVRIGTWNSNPFTWEDVALVDDLVASSGGNLSLAVAQANKLPKKKKLQLIKIILTLQNEEFIESKYKQTKNITIHVDDVKFLLENRNKITAIVEVKNK